VCHDQVAAGHRGQHREPLQLVRREQVCVVEQERVVGAQFHDGGHVAVDDEARGLERGGERVEQHGLAVAARTDHVHPARRRGTRGRFVHESTRRGRAREQPLRSPRRRLDTHRH
jgi:hypothetical protein